MRLWIRVMIKGMVGKWTQKREILTLIFTEE